MDRNPLNLLAGLWAARIVEGYGARARPEMSEGARAVLLDHLTRRLGSAIAVTPVGDWPDAANAALDAWEDEARTVGPRVRAFDDVAEVVRFRTAR
ncbi:hypothetical protein MBRA_06316 [Methylobacterium brachiatum]|nr:hypothetical protein MBRA_06316 [Methylobacterium brachiatum]